MIKAKNPFPELGERIAGFPGLLEIDSTEIRLRALRELADMERVYIENWSALNQDREPQVYRALEMCRRYYENRMSISFYEKSSRVTRKLDHLFKTRKRKR